MRVRVRVEERLRPSLLEAEAAFSCAPRRRRQTLASLSAAEEPLLSSLLSLLLRSSPEGVYVEASLGVRLGCEP